MFNWIYFKSFYFKNFINFHFIKSFIKNSVWLKKGGFALGFQFYVVLASNSSYALLFETLKAKEQLESVGVALKTLRDTAQESEKLLKIEKSFLAFEKELKDFKATLEEYERLGLDVKDFIEFRNTDPSSFKEELNFLKDYVRRANKLLESLGSLLKSPESITASEQIETNKTLRAMLEDNQARELRELRREIAKQKLLLERRKKEQDFLNNQYAYINRHSKKSGFGVFHPFTNKTELEKERKNKMKTENKLENKRRKFLGIF